VLTNIRGLVERLDLPSTRGMMPLFEAISNAIDAIQEKGKGTGVTSGTVRIRLIKAPDDLLQQAGDKTFVVDGFEVADDGAGFTDSNMASFVEAYTLAKLKHGGRGIGRFTFLKAFSDVAIRSVYENGGKQFARSFVFSIDREVSDIKHEPTFRATGTVVTMRGLTERYRSSWSHDPVIIAQRVIAHFLIRFASRSCPMMKLEAPSHEAIDLHRLFQQSVQPHIEERFFDVGGHTFALQAFRNRDGRARHEYHLCANGREVTTGRLAQILPELPDRFVDSEQETYTLIVLVTGEYFDQHANQERTSIAFQPEDDIGLDKTLLTRQQLEGRIVETLRSVLQPDLKETNKEKIAQIERFVEKAPEYRVLTHEKYRVMIEQEVQPGLSEEKLDEALLRIRRKVEDSMKKEELHIAALMEKESFEQYQERMANLIETMNDVGKAKLADYVAHRRTILDLVDQSLKRVRSDNLYPLERVLHRMICPMGMSSKDMFLEQQNLWLIDERLCFHTVLTSDKKLNKILGLEGVSGREPDIFAFFYDTPIGVAEPDNLPGGGVVIIEFKRPGRDDYDKDPADQIIQRFVEINQGNVKDIEGRLVNADRLKYIGYLIADLTPSLRRQVSMRYHRTADNEGYFATLPDGNGYVEIISYDKLVKDAMRRNRVLFDKLGLHKH
jgi:hypothetical protein